ncbi:MAG: glycosyltransferase family 2 protein [Ruminococcaceae bacterium]|nr:glycosyltransferase family 2 protein [Oscillospiraceae bacterium]
MSLAPIVMFVYNRADHFKKTVEALSKCNEAKDSELFIFSDGAKNSENESKVQAVRNEIKELQKQNLFHNITVFESPVNKGLAKSVIDGVTEIINRFGKVIVVEDDSVTDKSFLSFMNLCLDYYKDENRVGSVAGYTPVLDFSPDYNYDVFFSYRSCSSAWATWQDRWQSIDWELNEISDFYKSPALIQKLNLNGSDRFIRLYRQTKGNGSSWSVRFGAHLVKNDYLTVYPKYSYVMNIGCDESGVHSTTDDAKRMYVDLNNAISSPKMVDVFIDNDIQKLLKKHYSYGFVSDVKKFLYTCFIVIKERLKG